MDERAPTSKQIARSSSNTGEARQKNRQPIHRIIAHARSSSTYRRQRSNEKPEVGGVTESAIGLVSVAVCEGGEEGEEKRREKREQEGKPLINAITSATRTLLLEAPIVFIGDFCRTPCEQSGSSLLSSPPFYPGSLRGKTEFPRFCPYAPQASGCKKRAKSAIFALSSTFLAQWLREGVGRGRTGPTKWRSHGVPDIYFLARRHSFVAAA